MRSWIMARSNSAKEPTMFIIIRPVAVVVSIASVRERNPAPDLSILSIRMSRSLSDLESR